MEFTWFSLQSRKTNESWKQRRRRKRRGRLISGQCLSSTACWLMFTHWSECSGFLVTITTTEQTFDHEWERIFFVFDASCWTLFYLVLQALLGVPGPQGYRAGPSRTCDSRPSDKTHKHLFNMKPDSLLLHYGPDLTPGSDYSEFFRLTSPGRPGNPRSPFSPCKHTTWALTHNTEWTTAATLPALHIVLTWVPSIPGGPRNPRSPGSPCGQNLS